MTHGAEVSYIVTEDGPLLWFAIDRPDRRNAIDYAVMAGLEATLDIIESEPSYRALVLTGTGDDAFASGGDLRDFAALDTRAAVEEMALRMKAILARLEALDAWTIAALNGSAYGGGTETALACDFRVMADHAVLGFTQANFAVPPGWGGLTRLVEAVGKPLALRWLAEAGQVDAAVAERAGAVHELVPAGELERRVREVAAPLIGHDRALIGALKSGARNALSLPRHEAIEAELGPFVDCWMSPTHAERIAIFLRGRKRE